MQNLACSRLGLHGCECYHSIDNSSDRNCECLFDHGRKSRRAHFGIHRFSRGKYRLGFNIQNRSFQKLVIDGGDSIATVAYASVNVANAISMISSLLYGAGTSSKAEAEAATLLAFAKRIGDTNLVLLKKEKNTFKKYTRD